MNLPVPSRIAPPLALAAIWLAAHRHFGIQHDGLYYAAQALARLDPQAFRHDLFFVLGSQDDWTAFGTLHAPLVAWLGPGSAAMGMLLIGHAAWALAAWALARRWLAGTALWIGLAMVFAMPGHYGAQLGTANDILRYAEGFLTARSWAEPLVLAGIAATLGGRHRLGVMAIAAALLCHPLMGAGGALVLAAFHLRPSPARVLAAGALALVAALLLPAMDDAWLAEVRLRARYVLLDQWSAGELLKPLTWIGMLLALAETSTDHRRGAKAMALAAAAGMALALLGTVLHSALLIQAQPWRVLWLLQVGGLLALAALFALRWNRSPADRWLLAGFAAAALAADTVGGPLSLILLALMHVAWRQGPPRMPTWLRWTAGVALATLLGGQALLILAQLAELGPRVLPGYRMPTGDLAGIFQGPAWMVLPAMLAALLAIGKRTSATALALAVGGAAMAGAGWNRADDPLQTAFFGREAIRPFGDAIGRHETVYWQNNPAYAWFLLRQANYASKLQSASAVFSRPAAMESRRRLDRIAQFGSTDTDQPPGIQGHAATAEGLRRLCTDPILDAVIVATPIPGLDAKAWHDPLRGAPWYLHRCRVLHEAGPQA